MKLYALVTIGDELRYDRYGVKHKTTDTRCVGIYTDINLARAAVLGNYGDIYEEGWYPLAVIEAKESDVICAGLLWDEQHWFEWDKTLGGYQPIPRPEKFDQIIGWGVG